jgi:hypothetical protein
MHATICKGRVLMRSISRVFKDKERIFDVTFYSAIWMLLLIFVNATLTSMLWFFKISISVVHFPLSLVMTCIISYYIISKNCKTNKVFGITMVLSFVILLSMMTIATALLDCEYDSLSYQKFAIGCLADGWNPVLESSIAFNERVVHFPGMFTDTQAIWMDHYAKLPWMFAASIYKMTGSLESSKILAPLYACVAFFLVFNYFGRRHLNMVYSAILAFTVAINPVILVQLFTFYTDALLSLFFYVLIITLVIFVDEDYILPERIKLLLVFLALTLIINVKFTGFGLAGVFGFVFYVFWISKAFFEKRIEQLKVIQTTAVIIFAVAFSALFIGYSTYPKNYLDHGHIFHPLFGKHKVDIMTVNEPESFAVRSGIEKLFLSTFSRCSDFEMGKILEPKLKIPFSFTPSEFEAFEVDLRMSGFGIWYSGILILSVIIIFIGLYSLFKKRKAWFYLLFFVILTSALLLIVLQDSWWARYSPHYYLFIIFAVMFVLFYLKNNSKFLWGRSIAIIFIALTMVNLGFFAAINPKRRVIQSRTAYSNLLEVKKEVGSEAIEVVLDDGYYVGALYNLRDLGFNVRVKYKAEDEDYKPMGAFQMRYKRVRD